MRRTLPLVFLFSFPALAQVPPGAIRVGPSDVVWKAGPATLPPGSQVAILEGDPKGNALFTMRVKFPAGAVIKPHTHPGQERVTVIFGAVNLGYGAAFDKTKTTHLTAGSYYLTPPGLAHYLWFEEEAVLQVTSIGPWKLEPVEATKPAK